MFGTVESRKAWLESHPLIGGFVFVTPLVIAGGSFLLFAGTGVAVALIGAGAMLIVGGCLSWFVLRATKSE